MIIIMTASSASIADIDVKGISTLKIDDAYPNMASVEIKGDPARILWEKATLVEVNPPSQFNRYPFKESKTIRCYDYTNVGKGYACYIKIGNLDQAEVGNL